MIINAFRAQNGFRDKSEARICHLLGALPEHKHLQGAGGEHNVLQQTAQRGEEDADPLHRRSNRSCSGMMQFDADRQDTDMGHYMGLFRAFYNLT